MYRHLPASHFGELCFGAEIQDAADRRVEQSVSERDGKVPLVEGRRAIMTCTAVRSTWNDN